MGDFFNNSQSFLAQKTRCKMYWIICLICGFWLSGCSSGVEKGSLPETFDESSYRESGHFVEGGITVMGGKEKEKGPGAGIGVNSYLWQASLETISFMPLRSTDPFGGVILTEWYTPAEKPHERMKVDIIISSRILAPNSLHVKVFRQVHKGSGWVDTDVSADTARSLEDTILTRARKLKIARLAQ